jgi:hypothetical protein
MAGSVNEQGLKSLALAILGAGFISVFMYDFPPLAIGELAQLK